MSLSDVLMALFIAFLAVMLTLTAIDATIKMNAKVVTEYQSSNTGIDIVSRLSGILSCSDDLPYQKDESIVVNMGGCARVTDLTLSVSQADLYFATIYDSQVLVPWFLAKKYNSQSVIFLEDVSTKCRVRILSDLPSLTLAGKLEDVNCPPRPGIFRPVMNVTTVSGFQIQSEIKALLKLENRRLVITFETDGQDGTLDLKELSFFVDGVHYIGWTARIMSKAFLQKTSNTVSYFDKDLDGNDDRMLSPGEQPNTNLIFPIFGRDGYLFHFVIDTATRLTEASRCGEYTIPAGAHQTCVTIPVALVSL